VEFIVPELVAIVAALGLAGLVGLPGLSRRLMRRRSALQACLSCGRRFVLGERTCDCAE
jgi:hypothetical protein